MWWSLVGEILIEIEAYLGDVSDISSVVRLLSNEETDRSANGNEFGVCLVE